MLVITPFVQPRGHGDSLVPAYTRGSDSLSGSSCHVPGESCLCPRPVRTVSVFDTLDEGEGGASACMSR